MRSYNSDGDRSHSRSILDKISARDNMSSIAEAHEAIEISEGEDDCQQVRRNRRQENKS